MNNLLSSVGQVVNQLDNQLSAAIDKATSNNAATGTTTAIGQTSSVVAGRVASLVDKACTNSVLDLDAALKVCDLVNNKQNSYPREVAFAVLRFINNRYDTIAALNSIGMMDPDRGRPPNFRHETVALNALGLLDMLVKNCGYPFHLIIASKEFLNELVKRFPEKPNAGNVIQFRILELIQQWNSTLCVSSRYRDDFKNISDMYRLLSYKGYRFPGVSTESTAVLTASNAMLKSEEELEEEDRIAQGAKLQELLRLGTPAALEQANELMKILSGYETEKKPDYKKAVETEIDRIEAKASALNNLFDSSNPSIKEIEELLGATKSAQSRIQTMISNGEQEDRIERLLLVNDYINTTLENYQKFRSGQSFTKPVFPPQQQQHAHAGGLSPAVSPATGAISLIDFDDNTIPSSSPFSATNYQIPGVSGSNAAAAKSASSGPSGLGDLKDLDFFGSSSQPVQQPQQQQQFGGGLGGLSGLNSFPVMGSGFTPMGSQKPVSLAVGGSVSSMPIGLMGGSTGGFPIVSSVAPATSPKSSQPVLVNSVNLLNQSFDLSFTKSASPAPPTVASLDTPLQNLQVSSEPKDVRIFNKNGLQIKFKYIIDATTKIWQAQATFMNTTPVPFESFTFQLAVPKAMQLTMQPLSGNTVAALNQSQVTQALTVLNPTNEPLKVRFRLSYDLNGALVEETGEHVFQ
ncbi:UNVERIFIED_CONTAM: hypothetical protein HDU68_009329 [Siphonaria sp. JEL0065]|nr:hypothetical protein HDU68_009329 [Siphonaria sp. JEL0065]